MPLVPPRTTGAPAAPATDVARHASRAMLSRFIECPRSLMNLPNLPADRKRALCFVQKCRLRLLRQGEMHDRLARTLANRSARGFQEMEKSFNVVCALFATLHRARA